MTRRDEIAAALRSVEGVSGYRTAPSVISAGDAWVEWASTRWLNDVPGSAGGPRALAWRVYYAVPNVDNVSAIEAIDPIVEAIGDALIAVGLHIEVVEPVRALVGTNGETAPLLRYTLTD